jgi:hypothetical protein
MQTTIKMTASDDGEKFVKFDDDLNLHVRDFACLCCGLPDAEDGTIYQTNVQYVLPHGGQYTCKTVATLKNGVVEISRIECNSHYFCDTYRVDVSRDSLLEFARENGIDLDSDF